MLPQHNMRKKTEAADQSAIQIDCSDSAGYATDTPAARDQSILPRQWGWRRGLLLHDIQLPKIAF
jgi:hypothetical protein